MKERAMEDRRPWGHYSVLEEGSGYKVKCVTVRPGHRMSLQRHRLRAEHWFIVRGEARVTRNGTELRVLEGESIDIPRGALHRMSNPGGKDLVFVEVQTGDYFGEDDIERIEDDYGRTG